MGGGDWRLECRDVEDRGIVMIYGVTTERVLKLGSYIPIQVARACR